jgi:molybdopterin synthase catalytic subunit
VIRVQQEDFDIGAEIARLKAGRSDIGAIDAFVGTVRDQSGSIDEMTLEHYPGMTEAELKRIEAHPPAGRFKPPSSCIATELSNPSKTSCWW